MSLIIYLTFTQKRRNKNIKNYTHKSCKPLDEVEFSKEDNQLDMFENECEGMCGL